MVTLLNRGPTTNIFSRENLYPADLFGNYVKIWVEKNAAITRKTWTFVKLTAVTSQRV